MVRWFWWWSLAVLLACPAVGQADPGAPTITWQCNPTALYVAGGCGSQTSKAAAITAMGTAYTTTVGYTITCTETTTTSGVQSILTCGTFSGGSSTVVVPLGQFGACASGEIAVLNPTSDGYDCQPALCATNINKYTVWTRSEITALGVPAPVVPSPVCYGGCKLTIASQGLSFGFFLTGDTTQTWSQQGQGIFTGEYCPSAGGFPVVTTITPPTPGAQIGGGTVEQNFGGTGEGTATFNTIGGARSDPLTGCIDEDGDGLDDETADSCSLLATDRTNSIFSDYAAALGSISDGDGVRALANDSGGWLAIPSAIVEVLNPTMACDFNYSLPILEAFIPGGVSAGWCSVKATVDPYLQFFMFVLTVFILFTIFRKV